jgi:3-hydroxyacyl-CoA dehydrogenase
MSQLVNLRLYEEVAVIALANPPVNALTAEVHQAIGAAIRSACADPHVRAVVLVGAGTTFCGGADLREIRQIVAGQMPRGCLLPLALLREIEDLAKPVVAAIQGTALGGGLELAMSAHYRVCSGSARLGQPEVKIGLIPGAGGTQRLPRLVGVGTAVEMCAFGEPISAQEALSLGLVDRIVAGDLLEHAVAFARQAIGKPAPRTRERGERLCGAAPELFDAARERARRTKRGQRAPLAAIDAVEAATEHSFDDGCLRETELFDGCLRSTQSQAMIHAFFAERAVSKVPDVSAETRASDIQRVAIVGAGTMGGGIAMTFANAGIPTIVKDASQAALDRGMASIFRNYAAAVKKGALPQPTMDQRLALITPQLSYSGFEKADLIVEAVFEDTGVKRGVFAEIDGIAKPSCVLASNTSTLDIDQMASATKRPESVVGLHFFSPANVMRLLEIIRGRATSKEVIATSMALARRLGKIGVVARNCLGFIGSRMMEPYWREAEFLVEEGASVEEVNQALYDFGMAMGPLAMADLVGLDIAWRIRQVFREVASPGVRQPRVIDLLYKMGRFGQKTGRGWSSYDAARKPSVDQETTALIEQAAREAGIERRRIPAQEIVGRCVYALVNEGARLLEEGIALRASDIDVVYLTGFGFPVWRGGPMFYADTVGLPQVLKRIEEFQAKHGPGLWTPAPLLRRLAEAGETFTQWP